MKRNKLWLAACVIIISLLVTGGLIAWQRGLLTPVNANNPAKFIQHNFVDLTKIGSISKFRSGEGHDFSNGGETCRSMKHYFTPAFTDKDMQTLSSQSESQGKRLPPAPTTSTAVAIYAPVDGVITDIRSENFPVGKQIYITPDNANGYSIRIFHVYPIEGIKNGSHVSAGQHIGDISRLSSTDIAVQAGQINGTYVSYFDVMPDSIFASYQALGIKNRSDLIISREYRDAHPLTCNGEEFASQSQNSDSSISINGWSDPRMQQSQQSSNPIHKPSR